MERDCPGNISLASLRLSAEQFTQLLERFDSVANAFDRHHDWNRNDHADQPPDPTPKEESDKHGDTIHAGSLAHNGGFQEHTFQAEMTIGIAAISPAIGIESNCMNAIIANAAMTKTGPK